MKPKKFKSPAIAELVVALNDVFARLGDHVDPVDAEAVDARLEEIRRRLIDEIGVQQAAAE